MSKTWEEIEAEMDAYEQTKRYKFDQFIYRMRRIFTSPTRWPRNIKYWIQRANRGYADCDAWNGDTYLAGQIAGILTWIVKEGHGVAMYYSIDREGIDEDLKMKLMIETRDSEYVKYADIFREYAENGPAINEEWQKEFGGVLDKDLQEALQWLSEHFTEFWD